VSRPFAQEHGRERSTGRKIVEREAHEMAGNQSSLTHRLPLRHDSDLVAVRARIREIGKRVGLTTVSIEAMATAASEIARNAIVYAQVGEISLGSVVRAERRGVIAIVCDQGPGIPDVAAAGRDGYSTGGTLGIGLPSARRLVDEFELVTTVGQGTTVTLIKWSPLPSRRPP
jgi:serine/threonine-protein kinase RsbT